MIVLLDNGHGVDTPGKRSPVWANGSQLFEYEFNRDIVSRIWKGLQLEGITYKLIVPEKNDISLPERVRRVNDLCRSWKDALFVSVHGNASGTGKGTGWEIFTSKGKTKSDEYATVFVKEAEKSFSGKFKIRTDYADGDPDKEENFYVLKNTSCPAVLTENLFFDNETDCRYMMSNDGRDTIARIHVDAILKIAGK